MTGGLSLHLERNRLTRCDHRVPFHLGKLLPEGDRLIGYLANPTAGFFAGDHAALDVRVEHGSRLTLSCPGANRIHPARGPGRAELRQAFHAGPGSALEYLPEPLIPFAGSRFAQTTEIHAARDAELLWFDWTMPGRLARGEAFAFAELELSLDLRVDGGLSLRERARLRPDDGSLAPWKACGPQATVLTVLAVGWTGDELAEASDLVSDDGGRAGGGPLAAGGAVLRGIFQTPLAARRALHRIRFHLHGLRGREPARIGLY